MSHCCSKGRKRIVHCKHRSSLLRYLLLLRRPSVFPFSVFIIHSRKEKQMPFSLLGWDTGGGCLAYRLRCWSGHPLPLWSLSLWLVCIQEPASWQYSSCEAVAGEETGYRHPSGICGLSSWPPALPSGSYRDWGRATTDESCVCLSKKPKSLKSRQADTHPIELFGYWSYLEIVIFHVDLV